VARKTRSFVMRNHRLHQLPEGLSAMVPADLKALEETELLSDAGKRRVMEELSIPAGPGAEDESVSEFMTRRFGREAFEILIEPLLAGIYAGDAARLSLKATFPRLRELEQSRGSVLAGLRSRPPNPAPGAPFMTLHGGMAELVSALCGRLIENGVRIVTGKAAGPVTRGGGAWRVELPGRGRVEADAVVVATPAGSAAGLLTRIDAGLGEALSSIPFSSTAVVHLGFHRHEVAHELDGYGYVIPRVEGSDVLACTWTSSKWEDRAPPGKVLLRLYTRRPGSERELEALARTELRLTMGIDAAPVLERVFPLPDAMPQYTLGHLARLETIERRSAGLEGMYLAGASYRGVGIPDCIESGFRAARAAMEHLQ
jgi:protoporphyrinogen/coproporphyrinogen III oxidase